MPKNTPRHKRPTPSRARQGVALGVTTVVSAAGVVAGTGVANAADKPVSQGKGVFLSGSALGKNLDEIVKVDSAAAANMGDKDTVSDINPLGVTLLNNLNIPLGPVNLLKGNGLLTLGAVNQAAVAKKDGSAVAGSGAVADSGAIAVGGKDGVPASTAKLDLGALLGSTLGTDLVGGLLDLDLSVGAISASAAQAKGENGKQTGDYNIADLKLNLQSPLLAGLLGNLNLAGGQSQLTNLSTTLNGLNLNTLLSGLLGGLLGTPTVNVANLPVLSTLVANQDLTVGDGAVTVNLQNGKITVDVEKLLKALGLDLNNLPPNTELVRLILDALTDHITDLVKGVVKGLVDDITASFEDINITGSAIPLIPGPAQALPTAGLLAALQPTLDTVLDTVLDPVSDLLGSVTGPLLDPLFDALEDVLSIRVNVQNKSGGAFTERAIQVRVLPNGVGVNTAAAGDSLATVNLASATVGPGQAVDGATEDDGDEEEVLPHTGASDASAPLAAIGLGMVLAGAAATAGAGGLGNRTAGAHAGERAARGRRSTGGGRHRR